MIRKRGAPVLVELIRRQPHGAEEPMAPYPVHDAPRAAPAVVDPHLERSATWSAPKDNRDWRFLAIVAASMIALVALVSIIAFNAGKKKSDENWGIKSAGTAPNAPVTPPPSFVPAPEDPTNIKSPDPAPFTPQPAPAPTINEPVLQVGYNYLVVATLNRADAELAGQFLANNNIPAQLLPADKVDPRSARANNGLWQVLVLQGIPPGEYGKSEAKRKALEGLIRRLGMKWKADNKKAPTDFAQPYWVRYKQQ